MKIIHLIQINILYKFKIEACARTLKLEAYLHDHVKDVDTNSAFNDSVSSNPLPHSHVCIPVIIQSSSKSVPVYKLGIQFDGNPKTSFIEMVEEVSYARNVPTSNLFHSASDLLIGKLNQV